MPSDKKTMLLEQIYEKRTDNPLWEHQRGLLRSERLSDRPLKENLERLIVIMEKIAEDTKHVKAKDDERGVRIIDDYNAVAVQVSHDAFIKTTSEQTQAAVNAIMAFIRDL
jgi:hypothetical protein